MGASESKLVFKKGIFRLSEEQAIPATDPYWTGFWELPESVEDVFSLFSPSDIRRTRDEALENLETLLLAIISRLIALKNHPSFPDLETAPERDALNCIRVLTRVLPYIYEADHLSGWEERFFWGVRRKKSRRAQLAGEVLFDESYPDDESVPQKDENDYEEARPLAEELLDTLIDLLFYSGFTIPRLPSLKSKVTYAIWQSGVGCKQSMSTNKDHESNRCEVLRLLLTMMSKSMYMPAVTLPVEGVKAVTYLASCNDKQIVLSVLCSLLNTTIKYNSATWRLPYDHMVWKDSKQSLVVYSLQILLVLLLYPVPEDVNGSPQKNMYRHFLGRVHRPEDFQFLADGMMRILSQPMQSATLIPGTYLKQSKWAPETIMLFWEMLQCNKRFRSFIIESNRMHDFVIVMLFYAIQHKTDPSWQGVVRMCVFVLQTMSVEPAFGKNLNKKFEAQDTLPQAIRLSNFRGSYADYLIISIRTLITTSKGRLDAIYPALLAIVSNMAAYVQNLSMSTSTKLFQLLATMSSPSFLLANETNHSLLESLLEAINTMIEHQYSGNANLIYVALRSRRRIEALRTFTLEGGQQEVERAARRRKEGTEHHEQDLLSHSRRTSASDAYSPPRRSTADDSNVDENTFTIADSDDDADDSDNEAPANHNLSRTESVASSSAATDNALPPQLHGMSEKARGKQPVGASTFSRQSSTSSIPYHNMSNPGSFAPTPEWLASWLPELPLHTLLTIIKTLSSKLPASPLSTTTAATTQSSTRTSSDLASTDQDSSLAHSGFIQALPQTATLPPIAAILSSPSPIRVHLFEWSPLSLGWYCSILWSLIYSSEMVVAPAPSTTASTLSNTVTGNASAGVAPIGVWNGTQVKLFAVQTDGRREGPSLSQPRGAVDAVGTKLVDGVKGLNLGGLMGRVTSGLGVQPPSSETGAGRNVREI